MHQQGHVGEHAAIVGAGSDDDAIVFPDVAHDERDLGFGHIVDLHLFDASLGGATGHNLGHTGGVAVHGTVDDDDAFFGFLLAPLGVFADDPSEVRTPDQTMRRSNHLDLQSTQLFNGFQGLHGHLADDVGIIAAHLVLIEGEVNLVVEDAAVQSAKAAEGVVAEHDLAALLVGHHRLGPVHHRHHEEL